MSLNFISPADPDQGLFDVIETALEASGWQFERDGQEAVHCIAPTRWGEMGGLFACRRMPSAVHFSLTVDAKPQPARRAVISELIIMMNERLWLGHEYPAGSRPLDPSGPSGFHDTRLHRLSGAAQRLYPFRPWPPRGGSHRSSAGQMASG